MPMQRKTIIVELTISSGTAVSEAFNMLEFSGGSLYVPAAWTAAGLGFQSATDPADTYRAVYDHNDNLVEITALTVDRVYELPPEIFGLAWVQLWSQTGASGVNQAADRTMKLVLKS